MTTRRKARVIREAVKDEHTSHWDQDMLSWAELEALMQTEAADSADRQPTNAETATD